MPLLTVAGSPITDAVRALAIEGDGRAVPDSSFGVFPATINLHPNPGFENGLTYWAAHGVGAAIEIDATDAKFGDQCCRVTGGIKSEQFATLVSDRHGALTVWVKRVTGAGAFTITVKDGSTTIFETTTWTPVPGADGWAERVCRWTATASAGLLSIYVSANDGGVFRLDGVMPQQNFNTEVVVPPALPLTGSVVTPYVHRDDLYPIWAAASNLLPASFESGVDGWIAFGAGASVAQSSAWAQEGSNSLLCTVNGTASIGCRREAFVTLQASASYALSLWVNGPSHWTYKVEVYDGAARVAVDFTWAPGKTIARKILAFTATASPSTCSVIISRNQAEAGTFAIDDGQVKQQPVGSDPLDIPDGVKDYDDLTCPAPGIVRPAQMWKAIWTTLNFGTTEHAAGSVRFWRCRDDDEHREEAFYAGSSDAWGVRRSFPGSPFFSCQIDADDIPAMTGQTYLVVGQYTPTSIAISVNGSAFDTYPQSTEATSTIPTITNPMFEIAPTGAFENAQSGGQWVRWFAVGHGTLTNAGVAALYALAQTGADPLPTQFPAGSRPVIVWKADTPTYWRRTHRHFDPGMTRRAA